MARRSRVPSIQQQTQKALQSKFDQQAGRPRSHQLQLLPSTSWFLMRATGIKDYMKLFNDEWVVECYQELSSEGLSMGRKPGRHYSVESDAFWSKPCKNYTSIKWGYVSGPDRPHFSRVVRGCGHLHGKASLLFSFKALEICKSPHSPLLNSPLHWKRVCNGKGIPLKSRKANCRGGDFSLSKWNFNLMTWTLPPCICLEWMAKLGILGIFFNKPICSYFQVNNEENYEVVRPLINVYD